MKTCLVVLAVALAVACAQADETVVITPENMDSYGWSIEVNQGGIGALATFGPCVYENKGFITQDGMPMGRGAMFMECGYQGVPVAEKTPSTVWLGTNQFGGVPLSSITLNQIKTMTYYSYVSETPTHADTTSWSTMGYWRGPSMCPMLQITAISPSGGEARQFWVRPRKWGAKVVGTDQGMSGTNNGVWQLINAYTDRWYHPPWYEAEWPSWSNPVDGDGVCEQNDGSGVTYGEYYFMANPPMSAGWKGNSTPPGIYYSTGTGKPLNFEVGARHRGDVVLFENRANWYKEGMGFRGHVDFFTLGIDLDGDGDDTDPGERITYNFEPSITDPDPDIVMSSIKALNRNPLVGTLEDNAPLGSNLARTRFMHKVFGKVVERSGNPKWAALEDGSDIRQFMHNEPLEPYFESIRYYLWLRDELPQGTFIGSYWSGWGLVERLRGFNYSEQPPLMLWTDDTHLKKF